ncbi:MAG TPA: MG2 domain-containing protein [Gemmatimonadaceae bacterium]|nr:MG2 domain-containing protein [Gemmatimonadaceae bacterium]
MRAARLVIVAVAVTSTALPFHAGAQTAAPLRVTRTTPTSDGTPTSEISVTFDRPIAGSLDRTIDASTLLTIQPAVRGRIEWRDPVTIRIRPTDTLSSATEYTVTVANTFRAMDGSALAEPYRFTFRVRGPMLLAGNPVNGANNLTEHVAPNQRFDVVYSSPAHLPTLTNASYIELRGTCGGERVIRLRAVSQRAIRNEDDWRIRDAGGWRRDRTSDSLRRIVQLTPERALPRSCMAELVVPTEIEPQGVRTYSRWAFQTYGDLRVTTLTCTNAQTCPSGPLTIHFTNPVRGSQVLRNVKLLPDTRFAVRDTVSESTSWTLEATLKPHVTYAVVADTALRDAFGQRLTGNPASALTTSGFAPSIAHPFGRLLVERTGFRTLSVQHVNIDTLIAVMAPVPDSMESKVLMRFGWTQDDMLDVLSRTATVQRLPLNAPRDRGMLTSVRMPVPDASRAQNPTLYAIRMSGKAGRDSVAFSPSLIQVTDLGVHVRLGASEANVWVTSVVDGSAKAGANVELFDGHGKSLGTARTDVRGLARLANWTQNTTPDGEDSYDTDLEGYVRVTLGDDKAITAINRWDPDLSPWRFNVYGAWGTGRMPLSGTVFTERGIYRPGEKVYAKAIVRDGTLGSLRVPTAGDSLKWIFHDREDGVLREHGVVTSPFGTSHDSLTIPAAAATGYYRVEVKAKRQGQWHSVSQIGYRVAEYRPPEFLVEMTADSATKMPGDRFTANVQSRYLFGAPMGRAAFTWMARQAAVSPWELSIPGFDGWYVGESGAWWEYRENSVQQVIASGTDTLDARGERAVTITLPPAPNARASRVTLEVGVTDINRQTVGTARSILVHPADFYIAVKPLGTNYFWQSGTAQSMNVATVRPNGEKVPGTRVQGTIVRREWHRVRRERDGFTQTVGEWVSDTVARCTVTTAATDTPCNFTPNAGGIYVVTFTATDRNGRNATTSFQRWASGSDWVPWNDESQFKMDVIPDRSRYAVGDTATVLFASPFTNAEAWITVEREGVIEQRRVRITAGSTSLKFPITEAYAPNAFVSIVVVRGRSAAPGPRDDPGRPTIRVGYGELRVTPEVKRLSLSVAPESNEYRPGDSARVRLRVRDARNVGQRSEVTLWAVDEGVLALTGYTTPDPIDLMYQARGLGMRLASNMTTVAPQVPEGEKGTREPGGGGGADAADVLRSRFQTTAFFLGSVITDAQGNAVATAKLPDNLTTFRVMAVAVTAGDRYGKGESPMLVTRPLLARPSLPRFVRPGDEFVAGSVINRRDGSAASVTVKAEATGVSLRGAAERTQTLAAGRGTEVRFPFRALPVDSATFRFDVTGGGDADAVLSKLGVRPDHNPRSHTVAGVLRDTTTVDIALPPGTDLTRSRVSVNLGTSPLATIRGIHYSLRVYPYYCTEQLTSVATPLVALYRAQTDVGVPRDVMRRDIEKAIEILARRQRDDGGLGYWSSNDWASVWLSSYAGTMLLDARDAGITVDSTMLNRLATYISASLSGQNDQRFSPVSYYWDRPSMRLRERVAAADFLSRMGRASVPAENELLRFAGLMTLEDRARLAEVLARRGQTADARRLMESAWSQIRVEGNRAIVPDSLNQMFYFYSAIRPVARVMLATLAIDPGHELVGPMAETLAQQGRAASRGWIWNTQDYASAAVALSALDRVRAAQGPRSVNVRSGNRTVMQVSTGRGIARDSTVSLSSVVANNAQSVRLSLDAGAGQGVIYYHVTVTEVPTTPPTTPDNQGIRVERWYEKFDGGTPTTSAVEGELVRVRLRITVPATRQFVVVEDPLPAGLEAVDLSLRTASAMPGPGVTQIGRAEGESEERAGSSMWGYGSWDSGWWSPFDHRELRDDRVVYSANLLWPGTYTATYIARATTPGTFIRPPAHAEEMYNPAVQGRSDGGTFLVTQR